jgi:hypothetical protein
MAKQQIEPGGLLSQTPAKRPSVLLLAAAIADFTRAGILFTCATSLIMAQISI